MNKTLFATILLSATFLVVSCRKENDIVCGPITIRAVTEEIDGSAAKARTAGKYDVLWGAGDKIIVKGREGSDTFTLTDGAETTTGIFKQDKEVALSGEVESFYPVSIVSSESLVWPSEQGSDQVPPMYCKKSITGKTEDFSFKSLGSMLQVVLTTTDSAITLSSIRISDASKSLSGVFTVSDGKAVMTGSEGGGIVLDAGNVPIDNVAKCFDIAVPAGRYDNLKLTFFTNDGKGVAMCFTTMPEIIHNTVTKISLCAKNFKPVPTGFALDTTALGLPVGGHRKLLPKFTPADTYNKKVLWSSSNPAVATVGTDGMVKALTAGNTTISAQLEDEVFSASCEVTVTTPADVPADALSGLFSVSDNKVVRFAKSNLCKKSDDSFIFFENQYDMAVTNQTEFITWGQLSGWMGTSGNQIWQVLSGDEWKYLFGDNNIRKGLYAKHVTVVGVEDCLIIYPDGYMGTKVTDGDTALYNDSATWAQAQNAGVVCLTPVKADYYVDYWVASDQVLRVYFSGNDLNIWGAYGSDTQTYAARPVTEVK